MAETSRPRGLGRGLAALVAEFPTGQAAMVELEVSQVRPNPRQPRRVFDEDAIQRLTESVRADGVVQPIIVRDAGDGYEIVAGERRWRAARLAGLRTIPSLVLLSRSNAPCVTFCPIVVTFTCSIGSTPST